MNISFKKLGILTVIATCTLVLSACNLYGNPSVSNQTGGQGTGQQNAQQNGQVAATVTFGDNGVSPTSVTIKSGQAITWQNKSSKSVQVASNNHPTHTLNQELSNGQFVIEIAPGASSTVTLNKVGTWDFHDHLNPGVTGTVTVQ